jgi:hypothetical protein
MFFENKMNFRGNRLKEWDSTTWTLHLKTVRSNFCLPNYLLGIQFQDWEDSSKT